MTKARQKILQNISTSSILLAAADKLLSLWSKDTVSSVGNKSRQDNFYTDRATLDNKLFTVAQEGSPTTHLHG